MLRKVSEMDRRMAGPMTGKIWLARVSGLRRTEEVKILSTVGPRTVLSLSSRRERKRSASVMTWLRVWACWLGSTRVLDRYESWAISRSIRSLRRIPS